MRESMLKNRSTVLETEHADIIGACELPDEYDESDPDDVHGWLAENVIEIFNEVYMHYNMAITDNVEWDELCNDKKMSGFPAGVMYLWRENTVDDPILLPANAYVNKVFLWVEELLADETVFPPNEDTPFPETFKKYLKKLFSRIFRVFIILRAHDCLNEKLNKSSFKANLCLFLYFAWHWELLPFEDPKEAKSISAIMEPIRARYLKEREKKEKKITIPPK